MLTESERLKRLEPGFRYLEELDELGGKPDKKVPLCITVTRRTKKKLEEKENVSEFIERIIKKEL